MLKDLSLQRRASDFVEQIPRYDAPQWPTGKCGKTALKPGGGHAVGSKNNASQDTAGCMDRGARPAIRMNARARPAIRMNPGQADEGRKGGYSLGPAQSELRRTLCLMDAPVPEESKPAPLREGRAQAAPKPWQLRPATRIARRLTQILGWAVVLLSALLASGYLALQWLMGPRMDDLGTRLLHRIGERYGVTLVAETVHAELLGGLPVVQIRGLQLLDAAQLPQLQAGFIEARVALLPLLTGEIQIESLRLEELKLNARRLEDRSLRIAGLALDADPRGPQPWLEEALGLSRLSVRNLNLSWQDAVLDNELALEALNLEAENGFREHRWRLDLGQAGGILENASVVAQFDHGLLKAAGDWRHWAGSLFLGTKRLDFAEALAFADLAEGLPQVPRAGNLQLASWIDFAQGRVNGAQVRLLGKSLVLPLAEGEIHLAHLSTTLQAQPVYAPAPPPENPPKPSIVGSTQRGVPASNPLSTMLQSLLLQFSTLEVEEERGIRLALEGKDQRLRLGLDGALLEGQLVLAPLDAAGALGFAQRLPLPADLREALSRIEVKGELRKVDLRFEDRQALGTGSGSRYAAVLAVDRIGVQMQAPGPERQGLPSFQGLSGTLRISEEGGELALAAGEGATLRFPGVFEAPEFAVDKVAARLRWRYALGAQAGGSHQEAGGLKDAHEPKKLSVEIDQLEFSNPDGVAQVRGSYREGGKGAGVVDLQGQLRGLRADRIVRYLPLVVGPELRKWLRSSVHGGTVSQARFVLRGDIEDFPFSTPGTGQFLVEGQLAGSRLDYAPGWPAIEDIVGTLHFEAAGMRIDVRSGQSMGLRLENTRAAIAELDAPVLRVAGLARGQTGDMIRFVNQSPIATRISQFSDEIEARGEAQLDLSLVLPLEDLDRSQVLGTVRLEDNAIRLSEDLPPLSAVHGDFGFTESALFLGSLRGQFLGGEIELGGRSESAGQMRLEASGRATGAALREWLGHPVFEKVRGSLAYKAALSLDGRAVELRVDSDGKGLLVDLPEPLRKRVNEVWPIRVELVPGRRFAPAEVPVRRGERGPGSGVPREDQIRVRLREELQVWVGRARQQPQADLEVVSGVIAVATEPLLPARGLAITVRHPQIDVESWLPLLRASGSQPGPLVPERLALATERLLYSGRELQDAVIGASQHQGRWQLNLEAREASGFAVFRLPSDNDPGELQARFGRIELPAAEPQEPGAAPDSKLRRLPAMDLQVARLKLGKRELGAWVVRASSVREGDLWRWQLDEMQMQMEGARLVARGAWGEGQAGDLAAGQSLVQASPPLRQNPRKPSLPQAARMLLDFDLRIDDAGRTLDRLGFPGSFTGGEGRIGGTLSWQGLPWDPHYPTLEGRVDLSLGRGRFLKTEPGVAKLLSVLNLQSLPRRLSLDFSDIFLKGYSFDGLRGDARIANGVAKTDNFSMVGPQAVVGLRGSVDLVGETQDVLAEVVPNLDAGMASIVYGALINPFVGLGSLVAQYALSEPLRRILTYRYAISGSWEDPKVVDIGRAGLLEVLQGKTDDPRVNRR